MRTDSCPRPTEQALVMERGFRRRNKSVPAHCLKKASLKVEDRMQALPTPTALHSLGSLLLMKGVFMTRLCGLQRPQRPLTARILNGITGLKTGFPPYFCHETYHLYKIPFLQGVSLATPDPHLLSKEIRVSHRKNGRKKKHWWEITLEIVPRGI